MNIDTMVRFGKHARALAAALAIGATILSLPVGQAETAAKSGTGVSGCKWTFPDGTIVYYDVGQKLWDKFSGKYKTCGSDGNWHFEGAGESPVAPRPAGGGVYAP
jgi:hypothetical protein